MGNEQVIEIGMSELTDLLAKVTNNPLAEEDLPEMLRQTLLNGGTVLLNDSEGKPIKKLVLDENGDFKQTSL